MRFLSHPNLRLVLMSALAALALGMVTNARVFPLAITLVLAAHLLGNLRLPGKPSLLLSILLAVPFAVWYRYLPSQGLVGFAPIDILLIIACYTLSLGAYHLLTSNSGGSLNQAFAAAIIAFSLAGTASRHRPFTMLVIAFMALVLLQLRAAIGLETLGQRRRQVFAYAVAVALLVSLAGGIHMVMSATMPRFSRWLVTRFMEGPIQTSVGYTRVVRLGSVSDYWNRGGQGSVVLRHWRTRPPQDTHGEIDPTEYLRGAVFNLYERGVWRVISENTESNSQLTEGGRGVFSIPGLSDRAMELLEPAGTIYPDRELGETFFLPMGVQRVGAFASKLYFSPALTLVSRRPSDGLPAGGYIYYEPRAAPAAPDENDVVVPLQMQEELHTLAVKIMDPAAGPRENATRLAQYFEANYTYHLGIQLTRDKDPVLEFLQDIKAGHCEYFAASAALLLRSIGVPARYVIGFVCQEKGMGAGYRLSRRKDAHAWVEMFDPSAGWITFDPTPPAARPIMQPATAAQRFAELLESWWKAGLNVFVYGGVIGAFAVLWSLVVGVVLLIPVAVWGVLIVAALGWIYRANLRRWFRPRRRGGAATPHVKVLRAKLQRAEKLLAKHGMVREPGTPVGVFLRRVHVADLPAEPKAQAEALLGEFQSTRYRPR